ncbi:MAG TPA: hypothetical protein VEU29_01010, partial [Actinomycetota bacterium]|nr:hypothetical protein [Actinomycetota bacterium]
MKIISLWGHGSVPHADGNAPDVSEKPVSARRTWSLVALPFMRTGADGLGADEGAGVAPGDGGVASVTAPEVNV